MEMITVVNLNVLMRNPLVWIGALMLIADSTKPRKKKRFGVKVKSTRKGQTRKTARKAYKKKTTRRKTTKRKTTRRKGRMRKGSKEAKAWGAKMKRLRSKK
jgi:hypothetical protein